MKLITFPGIARIFSRFLCLTDIVRILWSNVFNLLLSLLFHVLSDLLRSTFSLCFTPTFFPCRKTPLLYFWVLKWNLCDTIIAFSGLEYEICKDTKARWQFRILRTKWRDIGLKCIKKIIFFLSPYPNYAIAYFLPHELLCLVVCEAEDVLAGDLDEVVTSPAAAVTCDTVQRDLHIWFEKSL